ncbi:short-chain dehydrogenase/reductase [Streptomyces sp. NPDC008150]|uniref:SDR family oxidoreductase n=1 Tax=Streptomyces sp. NPDC008150 TaxID=3364816 RepID=UPI0036E54AD2
MSHVATPHASPLRDRTAVVTGAARGVGAALARELSGRGMRVALLGREAKTLNEVAAELPAASFCCEVDVTDNAALAEAAAATLRELGPASVVVANAGIAAGGPLATSDPDLWRRVVDVNIVGSANTARTFVPQLRATGGYFLQVASTASFGSAPMMSAYCASKAGAEAFAQSLRGELAPERVGVGIAYLHWTDTDMVRDMDNQPVLAALREHQPWFARRVHSAPEVAGRLARGIERRRASIYAPGWLRAVQPLRPVLPVVVGRVSARHLSGTADRQLEETGVLGEGGQADEEALRKSRNT